MYNHCKVLSSKNVTELMSNSIYNYNNKSTTIELTMLKKAYSVTPSFLDHHSTCIFSTQELKLHDKSFITNFGGFITHTQCYMT